MGKDLSRTTARYALVALTLVALAIRLWGCDFLMPHGTLGDEWVYAEYLGRRAGHPEFDPAGLRFYPQFVQRLALLLWHEPQGALDSTAQHLARASAQVVLLRETVVWLSVLVVPATYLIARRFLERRFALLAAGLAATSFLGLWYAPQARPHAALEALCALTLLAALEVRRRPGWRSWLLAGLACALAVGTLPTAALLLLPLAVAHFWPRAGGRAWLPPCVALLLVAAGVRAFYPYLFPSAHAMQLPLSMQVTGQPALGSNFSGAGFARGLRWMREYDPWLALCAALGLLLLVGNAIASRAAPAARARLPELCIVAAFVVPMLLVFGMYRFTQPRYLLPLIPFFAGCAAAGLQLGLRLLAERRGARSARWVPAVLLATFLPEFAGALALGHARAADDTQERAALWLAGHVERGAFRIALAPGLELPLVRDAGDQAWIELFAGNLQNPWPAYQQRLAAPERAAVGWPLLTLPLRTAEQRKEIEEQPGRYLDELAADYVVLQQPDRGSALASIRGAVRARGKLVARFSPWLFDEADERPFVRNELDDPYGLQGGWVGHALRARCMGPVIEIYRLEKPAAR